MPSLRQLRYFVFLSEAGQYRRAAARAGISQPSLSLQIAALEERLGVQLVERRRRGVVMTPAGREVLPRARRILEELDALAALSETLAMGATGTLRLGSTPTIGPYLLPSLVARLHRDYPGVKLVIRDGAPRDLYDDLMAGLHDVILTQLPVSAPEVEVAPLFREALMLAMAADHPLARRGDIDEAALTGQDVLSLSPAFALHSQIVTLCREVGANLRADYEGTSLDALRQMAAMNMGLAFLPALYIRSEVTSRQGDLAVVPYRRGSFTRAVGLVWRKGSSARGALERLTETARAVMTDDLAGLVTPL